jgi:pimeloyl-ACP methyl ester carboxylesterase
MRPEPSERVRPDRSESVPTRGGAMNETWHSADDHVVHAVEWHGAPAAPGTPRPPVVLVHGLGGSTVNWELVGEALARRLGTRVVAFDLAGFGRTTLGSRRATLGGNGRLLVELVSALGPAVIVGNSMGGAIAVGLAARHPHLVHALVLVDPALPRPLRPRLRETVDGLANLGGLAAAAIPVAGPHLVRYRMRQLGPAGTVDANLRIACAHPSRVDATLRRNMVALTAYRAAGNDSARAYHDAILSLLSYTARRMPADLRAVRVPTLMIHGEHDRLVPLSLARATSRRRRDWTLEVFADCGHVPQIEQPERFVAVTGDWLDELPHV